MQISTKQSRRNQSGYALTITLCFLLVTLIVFASVMYWVITSARVTNRNNLFNTSQAAAQGAAERVIAQMSRDFSYQSINETNVYKVLVNDIDQTNWPVQFRFSNTNGTANEIYVSIFPKNWTTNFVKDLGSQLAGLYGYAAECDVIAMATPINVGQNMNMSAVVHQTLKLANVPVFQYGAFYNLDLDYSPGQAMTMNGKVHCNGTIWMYPQATATFNDVVEATITVTNKDNPNDQQTLSSYTTPINYNGGNPISGVDSLNMPVAGSNTNVQSILALPPAAVAAPNTAAYEPTNQIYLYNKVDLIISNAATGLVGNWGTNITIFYQDKDKSGGPFFQFTNNEWCIFSNKNLPYTVLPPTNSPIGPNSNYVRIASLFPFVTNVAFYDFREGKTVRAVQLDIAKLNDWLNNPWYEGSNWNNVCGGYDGKHGTKGHPIDAIYVYNSVPLTASQLPAVRVVNGRIMPSSKGLTVATPTPLYTLGLYNVQTNIAATSSQMSINTTNTAWTWPAALMGDAITILSGDWNDANSLAKSGSTYNNPASSSGNRVVSSNITVNAAMFEGIVPSTLTTHKQYSGGLENFLRLQEDWAGGPDQLWYNGSIVVMFRSVYATNYWIGPADRSGYPNHNYTVPTRKWGFDANFMDANKLPPCAPQTKAVIRGTWNAGR